MIPLGYPTTNLLQGGKLATIGIGLVHYTYPTDEADDIMDMASQGGAGGAMSAIIAVLVANRPYSGNDTGLIGPLRPSHRHFRLSPAAFVRRPDRANRPGFNGFEVTMSHSY